MPEPARNDRSPSRTARPPFTPRTWERLGRDERRRQIRDLMASAYWTVLPTEIRQRFLDLYRHVD